MSATGTPQDALFDARAAAEVYLRLPREDQARVVSFVGPGQMSAIFARQSSELRTAIAETLSSYAADVFGEPLAALPLPPEEEGQRAMLLGYLVCALQRKHSG